MGSPVTDWDGRGEGPVGDVTDELLVRHIRPVQGHAEDDGLTPRPPAPGQRRWVTVVALVRHVIVQVQVPVGTGLRL